MGDRIYYIATDPAFSEYVYFVMKKASPEQRGRLNPRELACFRSDKAIRDFADNETLERRMLMLTRLGLSWTMCLHTDKVDFDEMFKEYNVDYTFAQKNKDMVKSLKRGDMFVFGSRDMMMYQHLAAMHCHSQMFILDYDYLRAQKLLMGQREVRRVDKIKDAAEVYEELGRLMFHTISAFRQAVSISDVDDQRLRILLILLGFRNRYMKLETLCGKMGEPQRNTGIGRIVKNMIKDGLVTQLKIPNQDWESKAFTITEMGVDKVMTFIKYVKHKAFHELT